MSYVTIDRLEGGYTVSRTFRNLPAAMRAVGGLLAISEAAFEPAEKPAVIPHPTLAEILQDKAEADDLPPHDGRLILPPSAGEE